MKAEIKIIAYSGLLVVLALIFLTDASRAQSDSCRGDVRSTNDAAQDYRAAARDVGNLCTKTGSDCTGAKQQATAVLDQLFTAHQMMLATCSEAAPPPPPPPPPAPTIPGDLVITEIMVAPSCPGGEWFEVHNPTSGAFELQGLMINDYPGTEFFIINTSLVVPPGGFVVFANSNGSDCVLVPNKYNYGNFLLSNFVDTIRILNGTVVIDQVTYDSFWPLQPGTSVSLDPDLTDAFNNDAVGSWCSASDTPGAVNQQCF